MATRKQKANPANTNNPFIGNPTPALEGDIIQAEKPTKAAKSAGQVVNPNACGHVNEHWQSNGVQACVLPRGHEGNHSAPYKRLIRGSEALPTGRQYEDATSVWGEDAGISLDVIDGMLAEEKARLKPAPPSLTQRLTNADRERMRQSAITSGEIPVE